MAIPSNFSILSVELVLIEHLAQQRNLLSNFPWNFSAENKIDIQVEIVFLKN